jgi:hypothetical protein
VCPYLFDRRAVSVACKGVVSLSAATRKPQSQTCARHLPLSPMNLAHTPPQCDMVVATTRQTSHFSWIPLPCLIVAKMWICIGMRGVQRFYVEPMGKSRSLTMIRSLN